MMKEKFCKFINSSTISCRCRFLYCKNGFVCSKLHNKFPQSYVINSCMKLSHDNYDENGEWKMKDFTQTFRKL